MNSPKILVCCLAIGACGPNRTNDAGNVVDVSPDVLRMDSQQDDAQQSDAQEPDIVSPRDIVAVRDVPDVQRRDTVARDIFVCPDAGMVCSDRCVDTTTDRLNCGTCDNVCPVPSGGYAGCLNSVCNQNCNAEDHLCGESCVPNTSPASCGALCTPCPTIPNGYATCDGRWCGLACDAGFKLVGSTCVIEPPRLVAPLSVASTTTPRPTLRWELSAVLTGSHVEVCADRSCSTVEQTHDFPARETSVRLQTLTPGTHFWRVSSHSLSGAEVPFGHTWEFFVGYADTPVDSSWGTRSDFNGDGKDDLVANERLGDRNGVADVYWGRPGGINATPDQVVPKDTVTGNLFATLLRSAPDVNGDGFADLVVGGPQVLVYHGGPTGFPNEPSSRIPAPAGADSFGDRVDGVGDLNLDGFGDIAVTTRYRSWVFLGSASGVSGTPSITLNPGPGTGEYGRNVSRAGDVNGDGYADFFVGTTRASNSNSINCMYFGAPGGLSSTECSFGDSGGSVPSPPGTFLDDVNGDGYADTGAIVGTGFVQVMLGGSPWTGSPVVSWTVSFADGARTLASAGDINHDGKSDVIVGLDSLHWNEVYIYLGRSSAGGASGPPSLILYGETADRTGLFGSSVLSRDLNADGFDDMIVSSPSFNLGTLFIYNGGASGLATTPTMTLTPAGGSGFAGFGSLVAALSPRRRFVLR